MKEQIYNLNKNITLKNNEIIKNKDKEIEELKNQLKNNNSKNDNLMKEHNMLKTENELIKDDIKIIINSINKEDENKLEKNNNNEEKFINEILEQLIKAKNIISFLFNEKSK